MVFGTRRAQKPVQELPREDVIGSLYPETVSTDTQVVEAARPTTPATPSVPAGQVLAPNPYYNPNESVIDPHARFNGQYTSDRDLRIEGEAQGEIECQGTLVISPAAKVRSAIKAHNVIVNGDFEGDVDCGGRFEIGSTGRVKGTIKTQILVVNEGGHWDGSVVMSHPPGTRAAIPISAGSQRHAAGAGPRPAPAVIFSKGDRGAQPGNPS